MGKVLIHPELIELFTTFKLADIDYEDNSGSSNAYEFADRARRAQKAFRDRKAELEAAGVEILGEETPNALGEGRERGLLREASSGEAATSTDGLAGKRTER